MLRRLLALWLLGASVALAADSSTNLWFPTDGFPSGSVNTQAGIANELRCMRWVPSMGIVSATRIAWGLSSTTAGSMSVGVYSSDGGTQITETGAVTVLSAAVNSKSSLTPFTLVAGTPYWTCWCSNATTFNYMGANVGTVNSDPPSVQNAFVTNIGQLASGCTGGDTPPTISPAALSYATVWKPIFVLFSKE